jgi:DNA-binding IclR family transcriptional regulator
MMANAGRRGPLHATASGKLLLALAADTELFERILGRPLRRYTETTITDPVRLRHELAEIRQRSYATCWQELCSLAVALRDHIGRVIGSLTVAGPATRLTTRTLNAHLVPLHTARQNIERQLGAPPNS